MLRRSLLASSAALLAAPALAQTSNSAGKTLRVVMQSDLKILDPGWTTAYIVREHGYMVYDNLFALDAQLKPRPQMVDSWTVSDDKLTWRFKLRDGLVWHDGPPVTSADVVPSIRRWTERDAIGGLLAKSTAGMKAIDDKTFEIALKEPFPLMLPALARPSSIPLFIMPKRVAETPVNKQIGEFIGSGPFVFRKDEWKPGEKVVYQRFANYVPRQEPPSAQAGGKVAKVDRVEWISISDTQTAANALSSGEIDMIQQPSHDLLPQLEKDKNIEIVTLDKIGSTYILRFNWTQPPFDDVRYRRAAEFALNQEDFLKAVIGDPRYYKTCRAMFGCGTPYETNVGMDDILKSNFAESKKLLKEAGYDGKPIVLLQSTDLAVLTNLAPVAKELLERGGFKVDMQSMDWQTVVARRSRKDPVDKGGWNIAMTGAAAILLVDPVANQYAEASGDRAQFGWPTDAEIEKLRMDFARETDFAKQKEIAAAVQKRILDLGVTVPLGQFLQPLARRKNVKGNIESPITLFWNVEKS